MYYKEKGQSMDIKNFASFAKGDQLTIFLHGVFGNDGNDSAAFTKILSENPNAKKIKIDINSVGGSFKEGLSIYNILESLNTYVEVFVSGFAASAAVLPVMAANKVIMPKNTWLMIHKPSQGGGGNATELKKTIELLDKMQGTIIDILSKKMNITRQKINAMLNEETWLSAIEAREFGIVNEIVDEIEIEDNFENKLKIPEAVLNQINWKKENQMADKKGTDDVKNSLASKDTEILALKTQVDEYKNENKSLRKELKDAGKEKLSEIQELQNKVKSLEDDARKKDYTIFCNGLVSSGQMKPVDVAETVENMTLRFDARGHESVKNYMDSLKKRDVVVNLEQNFANNGKEKSAKFEEVEQKALEIYNKAMSDGKPINMGEAYKLARGI
jgi:ATP-dependent Clp protease, protease subunit